MEKTTSSVHVNDTGEVRLHENDASIADIPLNSNVMHSSTTNIKDKRDTASNKSEKPLRAHFISMNSLPRSVLTSAFLSPAILHNSTLVGTSTSPPQSPPKEKLEANNPTVKVLEALTKFQTCLLILSNTVVSLHESLKLMLPGNSSAEPGLFTMPAALGRAFSTRNTIPQPDIPPENNNIIKSPLNASDIQGKLDNVVVSFSNSSAVPSLETVTSDSSGASIVSACKGDIPAHYEKSLHTSKPPQGHSRLTTTFAKLVRYLGLFLALFASVCMSLVTLVVKFMEGYNPVSKVIWRLQGVLLPSLLILLYVKYYKKQPLIVWQNSGMGDIGKNWKLKIAILLIARGIVGCSADIFQYYSLKYLPLADSTVISFSTPIFVCILAKFVLKEHTGYVTMFSALLTLCGVIVITRPPILTGEEEMSNTALLGNILALLCMISATFTTVIMRSLKHCHFSLPCLALGIIGTMEGFLVSLFTSPFQLPHVDTYHDLALATLTAGLFFFGQLAQTLALKYEEANVVSLVRTCDVIFAFVWQVNLLHQKASIHSYVGAIIVILGVFITAVRKWISDLPEHSVIRNKLFFLLR